MLFSSSGLVVGGPEETPLKHISVHFIGKELTTTDQQGIFTVVVPPDAHRLVFSLRDATKSYADTTVVVPFERGRTVFHKIKVNLQDTPVPFHTSEELTVPLGHARDGSAVAHLEIPAKSFLETYYGDPYQGLCFCFVSLRISKFFDAKLLYTSWQKICVKSFIR